MGAQELQARFDHTPVEVIQRVARVRLYREAVIELGIAAPVRQ